MFRKVWAFALVAVVAVVPLVRTSTASAATPIGSTCVGARAEENLVTLVPLANVSNPAAVAIPTAGVITSWTVKVIPYPGGFSEKATVFRPTGVPNMFTVVGESTMEPIIGGANTFPTRIPVQAGDRLGVTGSVKAIYCGEAEGEGEVSPNVFGSFPSEVPLGGSATFAEYPHGQVAASGTVEPDADGDGYGDETQDKCPTDASTQGPCPALKVTPPPPPPAPPITLSATAASRKNLVTVAVTSSAQAMVTVAGSVKLGKGGTAKLSGGTQIVAPGGLAKFTVLFPMKLKTALKQLPSNKKLSLILTASAPGATTTNLTVKVPGELKPVPKHHHGK